jgi:2-polyprenyl-6-methoxyphenol hydroxylase-like FAD-dependent oxidoreductase
MSKVVVIGAGIAGLATAIACARGGHQVIVLERDVALAPEDPLDAPAWERRGVPHFTQPHAFLGRGIKELRANAPDIYTALLDVGAYELDLRTKMPPGDEHPDDEDLIFLGCRRPVLEWVLRQRASEEANIELRSGEFVQGLDWDRAGSEVPSAVGVLTQAGQIQGDLIVDASGRSSALPEWIVDGGGRAPGEVYSDCGLVYYSRYYRFLPGRVQREGPWLLGPRAELGYLEVGTFWGDNDTFAIVQQIRPEDRELRSLRHSEAFTASLKAMPVPARLMAEGVSEPITDVLPMGQLRNTLRSFMVDDRPVARGVIAIGDALCHTNPRYAWGLSLSLVHAFTVARLLDAHPHDAEALTSAFYEEVSDELDEAFRVASDTDEARKRYWRGEAIDYRTPAGSLPLFLLLAFPIAGMLDREIFRAAVKRLMFLEMPYVIESDEALMQRGANLLARFFAENPPAPNPTRDELLEIIRAAVPGA